MEESEKKAKKKQKPKTKIKNTLHMVTVWSSCGMIFFLFVPIIYFIHIMIRFIITLCVTLHLV